MLKTRVIPTILWKNENIVKGIGFNSWRRVGSILPIVKVYSHRQVDELIVLDIAATHEQRHPDLDSIYEFSSECFVPLTIGGGITNIDDVKSLLRAGADKVSINTEAYTHPNIIMQIAREFGTQCVVVSVDVKKVDNKYMCYSHCGTVTTGLEISDWAKQVESLGAGEILITSIERDGTMQGYDLELLKKVTATVKIPVIASGGAGTYKDFQDAVIDGKVSAVAASSMYLFTQATPAEAKQYLKKQGISIRI